jgi:hypothetical protein
MSHVEKRIVDEAIEWFKEVYGDIRISRGYFYDY